MERMKKIDCLKQFLIRCCCNYYVMNSPIISDKTFDLLLKDLDRRERNRGFADKDSPTQVVYGDLKSQYTQNWMKSRNDMEISSE